jgi:hypothetical protein
MVGRGIDEPLPVEQAAYFDALDAKHFGTGPTAGSVFTGVPGVRELLGIVEAERGSLDGDDRVLLLAAGASERSFLPGCRYLLCHVAGRNGMADAFALDPATPVRVVRTKPGAPCSLVVDGVPEAELDFATVIIGPNEDADPSSAEMVWTAHPGMPARPSEGDRWTEGATLTAADVVADARSRGARHAFVQIGGAR